MIDNLTKEKLTEIGGELRYSYGHNHYDYAKDCFRIETIYNDIVTAKINFVMDSVEQIALKLALFYEEELTGNDLEELVKELE